MSIKRFFNLSFPGFSQLSIGKQIPLLLGGTLIGSLLFAGLLATSEITKITHQQADRLGNALAEQTANAARDLLVTGDRLSLNVMLGQLTHSEYITRATIFSIDNKRIASTESPDYDPDKTYALYTASIDYQNVIAGQLRLEVDMDRFERPSQEALLLFLGLTILLGTTGVVVAWNYGRSRSLLLARCVRQLQGLGQGARVYNNKIQDEVLQLAAQLEYLITSGYKPAQPVTAPSPVELDEENIEEASEPALESPVVLAIRFSNMAHLNQTLNQVVLLTLLEKRLPRINDAAKLYNGSLEYSAEGNAYVSFSRHNGEENAIQEAICCARLVQKLITVQEESDPAALSLQLGISTLDTAKPGDQHPSLIDAASSQAIMLANLGDGLLILDTQDREELEGLLQISLSETGFGEDIVEVGPLPEQFHLLIDRQAEQIRNSYSAQDDH
ncbi:hypothetical protein [Sansalvadorimonas verongulae]|uniref:hypothetical protein n=1 Tax=Sansalvadorimonas verongulae TaxID=2172824 RepID=UPI0012BC8FF9|nr:hypothetical protein [Sansalvadorimonas verongulae]MTI13209.1 hypothetical protein [Sansalvadorimonas verongulae]